MASAQKLISDKGLRKLRDLWQSYISFAEMETERFHCIDGKYRQFTAMQLRAIGKSRSWEGRSHMVHRRKKESPKMTDGQWLVKYMGW